MDWWPTARSIGIVYYTMKNRLDHKSPIPLFVQITEALRWMIANGVYAQGERLLSAREAAAQWGVNRHTVARAYRELINLGIAVRRASTRSVEVVSAGGKKQERSESNRLIEPASGDPEIAGYVAGIVREAERRFGLQPKMLAAEIIEHSHREVELPSVAVVECNEPMATDLAEQIAARWAVTATVWVIGRDEEAPTGATVATMFHFADLRRSWIDKIDSARFVSVRPNEALRDDIEAWCSGQERPVLTVMGDDSLEEARNQSADLHVLFPEDRYDFALAVRSEALPPLSATECGAVLVAPLAWGNLSEDDRQRPGFFPVRYSIDPLDLETLGRVFDWRPRQPAQVAT